MKIKNKLKFNIRSDKGFTMQDLLIACFIFVTFVGIIGTLMYSIYKSNMQVNLMTQMTAYSVQILEDIDKISYEDAQKMTGDEYKSKFSIPGGFNVSLELNDYGNGNLEDVIKIVDLKMSYEFAGETQVFNIKRLKIKEI